jgi:hypothetical protein
MSLGVSCWVNSVLLGNLAPVVLLTTLASLEAGSETSLRVDAALSLATEGRRGLIDRVRARHRTMDPERDGLMNPSATPPGLREIAPA